MHKIAEFIMSKKVIPVILVLVGASFFIASSSWGKSENDNPKLRYTKILRNVGFLLEQGHVSPKKIDDKFSMEVFNGFLKELDPDKSIFLKSDIDSLSIYDKSIDDEIKGAEIKSFFAIQDKYILRQNEVIGFYKSLLETPFDFSKQGSLITDVDKLEYPANAAERKERWYKRIKYMVLDKYVLSLNEREKNKGKEKFEVKSDATLEKEAREAIGKQLDRVFTTKKNRETNDENFSTFVNVITNTMDPHTTYFPPVDLRTFNESMKGSFFGIGAVLKEEEGKIKIGPMQTGMPAQKSGEVQEGDEIMKVAQGDEEPVDVTGYGVQEAVKIIRGEKKGSEVRLTLRKIDGSIKVVSLIRDKINLDETFVKSVVIEGQNKIGYIYLPEFYANFEDPNGARCAEDMAREIEKLKAENIDGIVLDLRGNGGGSLYDVVQIVGLFIKDGPVTQVKGRGDKPNVLLDKDKTIQYDGPLTVLVDETSASASEIFAAAIQDYGRGIIIGSTSSFGKGTVQRNIPLNPENESSLFGKSDTEDLGTVKLTLQKFYRINGGATQLKGVIPDVILPDRLEFIKFREKDNPDALQWDEIAKVPYTPWVSNFSMNAVIAEANKSVSSNPVFQKIKKDVDWLAGNVDKDYSLNIDIFKQDQKKLRSIYQSIDSLYKLDKPMKVENLTADLPNVKKTVENTNRNTDFIKRVSRDIYIDESVKILNNMISRNNLAKAN